MMTKLKKLGRKALAHPATRLLARPYFLARAALKHPHLLEQINSLARGQEQTGRWPAAGAANQPLDASNPLRAYFESHREGPGIWKWQHYFDIYDRHFARFRGREVHVLEIGIYSGGSLPMWREYFGPGARVYGVDIEPACRAYEDERTQVFIGDQADRGFWKTFRAAVPTLDVVIDDGGHLSEQQIVTLEELLPHLRPGGVFLCEDVCGVANGFAAYVSGAIQQLNASEAMSGDPNTMERRLSCKTNGFQSAVGSIHSYPFVTVVEKRDEPLAELVAPKHGTQWEPFLR